MDKETKDGAREEQTRPAEPPPPPNGVETRGGK